MGQPEHGEAGQVDPGGEQSEVGGALEPSADPGPSSAVPAAHQVADLAFDLGSGGGVVGLPAGVGLAGAGASQRFLVGADADAAPSEEWRRKWRSRRIPDECATGTTT